MSLRSLRGLHLLPLLAAFALLSGPSGPVYAGEGGVHAHDASEEGARARRIRHRRDLPSGPLAHAQVGDWLLENGKARFVVQDAPARDLHSIGQYGGNLIDAELRDRPGRESFFELQPAVNIETVLNARSVEVVNDGSDGGAAVLRACGPDDLLDYANPSSQLSDLGTELPAGVDDQDLPVEGCTEYRLEPGETHVEVETTLFNLSDEPLGLFIGDYVNGMGTLEQWTPPLIGVGELLVAGQASAQSYFGFREARGVDYALVPEEVEGVPPNLSGFASSFTTGGVSFVLRGHILPVVLVLGSSAEPTFVVPAGGSQSFTRRFAVGDGSPATAAAQAAEARGDPLGRLEGCVTVGGAPAPGARVAVGPEGPDGAIRRLASLFVADEEGCYGGRVPAGSYQSAAALRGAPFEESAASPPLRAVEVAEGESTTQDFALPATGRLEVRVRDGRGRPVPARVSVVGIDESPEPKLFATLLDPNDLESGLFRDVTKDPLPHGVVAMAYTDARGHASLRVEPGRYQVVVSRGWEWSIHEEEVALEGGAPEEIAARLAHVVDTRGFVSSDYHVHLVNSPDSRIAKADRVRSFAGEGVDNLIATDHDAHTDLSPTIRRKGFTPFLHSTVGEEITTFDYGHFNAYPQGVDPTRPSGGSTDWAGEAPVGEDFPSKGHFVKTPAEIEESVEENPVNRRHDPVVQVNHVSSHFGPLRIDTSVTPPRSFVPDPSRFRLDPSVENFFHPFPALELWNGASIGAQREFLRDRIGIWMNLLSQGMATTAIADTDTHTFFNLRTAGARTWTPAPSDRPSAVRDRHIGRAVRKGKAIGGQGLFVEARLEAPSTGEVASHRLRAPTQVRTSDGRVELDLRVQAPTWSAYDTIEIYANAETSVAQSRGGTPVFFGAEPTRVLEREAGDFAVERVPARRAGPGAERLETELRVPLEELSEDTWVVVVVKGTRGVSPPLFPVAADDLDPAENASLEALAERSPDERGVRALGFTNALYVDVDGNGRFDPPGVRVAQP